MFQSTPLVVNGVLYSTAGTRRAVVALDAASGELKWVHGLDEGERGAAAPRQFSGRGLSYWSDGKQERIYYVTAGYRLIGLDARTGARVQAFGVDGQVDLMRDFDQDMDPLGGAVGLHSTPLVTRDVIIVGAAHRTGANPASKTNVKGYVRAYDVRTGKRLWVFHTIPRAGEFGAETWLNGANVYTGNTGVWAQISADESLGLAYLPVELPTGDYYGGDRPARTCSPKVSWRWTSRRACGAGTSSWCTTACGTWTSRAHRFSRTSSWPAARSRRWRSSPSRDSCTCSTARPVSLSGRSKSGPSRRRYAGERSLAHAAVPDEATGVRTARPVHRRPDRLHAGAPRRGRAARVAVPHRPDVHAALGQPRRRPDRHPGPAPPRAPRPTGRAVRTIPRRTSCTCRRRHR